MMALVAATIAAIAVPHLLRLERCPPVAAVVVWASALLLRALLVVLAAAWLVLFFPATDLFAALTHWCWHHLLSEGLNGHDVGHAATVVPALLLTASLASVGTGVLRLGRALRRLLAGSIEGGPAGSLILGGSEVVLAVAGLRRPRMLVSAGALLQLDDDELAAGLAHERAHVERRHRYLLVNAALCAALAGVLPGTRRAADQLAYHLERDADRAALAGRVDRHALVSVLRKASRARFDHPGVAIMLGGPHIEDRIEELVTQVPVSRARSRASAALASGLASAAVMLAVSVGPVVAAGIDVVRQAPAALHCAD